MASGHMNRVKRPDTWLHRPMLQNVKKVLANPEPSTHDPERTCDRISSDKKAPDDAGAFELSGESADQYFATTGAPNL
jgi:hypothetical protein